jgi:hypothetical protein
MDKTKSHRKIDLLGFFASLVFLLSLTLLICSIVIERSTGSSDDIVLGPSLWFSSEVFGIKYVRLDFYALQYIFSFLLVAVWGIIDSCLGKNPFYPFLVAVALCPIEAVLTDAFDDVCAYYSCYYQGIRGSIRQNFFSLILSVCLFALSITDGLLTLIKKKRYPYLTFALLLLVFLSIFKSFVDSISSPLFFPEDAQHVSARGWITISIRAILVAVPVLLYFDFFPKKKNPVPIVAASVFSPKGTPQPVSSPVFSKDETKSCSNGGGSITMTFIRNSAFGGSLVPCTILIDGVEATFLMPGNRKSASVSKGHHTLTLRGPKKSLFNPVGANLKDYQGSLDVPENATTGTLNVSIHNHALHGSFEPDSITFEQRRFRDQKSEVEAFGASTTSPFPLKTMRSMTSRCPGRVCQPKAILASRLGSASEYLNGSLKSTKERPYTDTFFVPRL